MIKPKRILVSEPVTALRRIPIIECNEPLVDFRTFCPGLLLDEARFTYRRETLLRKGVAERLNEAISRVPKGLKLAMLEGWRAPHIQRRMYLAVKARLREQHPEWNAAQLTRKANQFTAPMSKVVPPPHTTGAALDVFVARPDGTLLNHVAPYERYDIKGFLTNAPGLAQEAREARDILRRCFVDTGITNYPSEYWHWSYGDQGWAYRGGHEHAIYDSITPPNWSPDPADVSDLPLEWREE